MKKGGTYQKFGETGPNVTNDKGVSLGQTTVSEDNGEVLDEILILRVEISGWDRLQRKLATTMKTYCEATYRGSADGLRLRRH